MKSLRLSLAGIISLAALAPLTVTLPANAQNLVTNASFEDSAPFTPPVGWTEGGAGNFAAVTTGAPNTGFQSYGFGSENGQNNTLSQTLTTVAGQQYTFSYFLENSIEGDDFFSASWDGNVQQIINPSSAEFDFTQFSFNVTASSTSTVIEFAGRDIPSGFFVDDVSVVANASAAAPEPGTLTLLAVGVVGFIVRRPFFTRSRVEKGEEE